MLWTVGVTTVPERRADLLPQTLTSLAGAGFDRPRLFVDGSHPMDWGWDPDGPKPSWADLDFTWREPAVGAFGNWALALLELHVRTPQADRFAIFQDDVLAVRGLREYLDATCRGPGRYWSLYTFLDNERLVAGSPLGTWHESELRGARKDPPRPDPAGRQVGAGALGLVFTAEGVRALLSSPTFVAKPASADHPRKNLDGTVVEALNLAGFREMVHHPSLLYHAGRHSTVEPGKEWVSRARSWPGEDFDARTLLRG